MHSLKKKNLLGSSPNRPVLNNGETRKVAPQQQQYIHNITYSPDCVYLLIAAHGNRLQGLRKHRIIRVHAGLLLSLFPVDSK